jgi:general secretion pathway protein F
MVEAGEASGRLDEILDRLADYTEEQQYLRQKLGVALIYPVLLTVVAILIVTALLTYVVPEVVRVFEQTGQQLPLLTRSLIASSEFIRGNGVYLLVGTVGLVIFSLYMLRRPSVRYQRDLWLLRLPFINRLSRIVNTSRLARVLAILTGSGVPLLEALRIGAQVISNMPIREAVLEAAASVREGGRLHETLNRSGYFPPLLVHMLAAGEESGELESMLDRAAIHHERELGTMVSAATALIEPLLILVMGGIVLLIVLAILLPIFEMNQLVGM